MSSSLPSTVAYIAYYAFKSPKKIAIIEHDGEISYGNFYKNICQMLATLRKLDLKSGDLVAVESTHFYKHWVVLLAYEILGIQTLTYSIDEIPVLSEFLDSATLIMCFDPRKLGEHHTIHLMDQKWFSSVGDEVPDLNMQVPELEADQPLRLVHGSGSTDRIKSMTHTILGHDLRIKQCQFFLAFNEHSRYFLSMSFCVQAFQAHATACIRMGGTCIYDISVSIAEGLRKHQATHATFVPFVLSNVLNGLEETYQKADNLTIFTIGAPVPKVIRDRVKKDLATDIIESYGTDEIGSIATMDHTGHGIILPEVTVEVVDDNDQPIKDQIGRVRVKSNCTVRHYENHDIATEKSFRNGWFYPNDLGVMKNTHVFKLIGRCDDQLNINGIKYDPYPLEKEMENVLPITGACIITVITDDHIQHIHFCVVPQNDTLNDEIRSNIKPLIPPIFEGAKLSFFKEFPRTTNGKIQRTKLSEFLKKQEYSSASKNQ